RLIALRKAHPSFRRRGFFQGRAIKGAGIKDVVWLKPDGQEMTDQEWNQEFARCLGLLLSGDAADQTHDPGHPILAATSIILTNAHHDEIPFTLPMLTASAGWITLVDTSCQTSQSANTLYPPSKAYPLQARSLVLLVERTLDGIRADDRRRAQLP